MKRLILIMACLTLSSLVLWAEEIYRIDHAVISYTDIPKEYAEAIAHTAAAARSVAVEQFEFDMPETVSINLRQSRHTRLFTDGRDYLRLSVRSERHLRKPSESSVFHLYGICHEMGHIAMYRLLPEHGWLTGAAKEGWAHYLGSRIVDLVYAREGEALWPDPYNYLADGTARLKKQLAAENPREVVRAAGLWMELVKIVGDKGVAPILQAWGKATIDPQDPGAALRKVLLATNADSRLADWWNKAEPLFVFKRPRSGFVTRPVEPRELIGQPMQLAHDDGSSAGVRSIAGGGHAVRFEAPGDTWYLTAVRIFGSRYGYPTAPRENFHIWLCDADFKVIADFPFPYAKFTREAPRWVTLSIKPTNVPSKFIICVGFNPTNTKGVFVHHDREASGKSLAGLPGAKGYPFPEGDWMIRIGLDQPKTADALSPAK